MSAPLVRYEATRRALAEACRVDEVKDVRDKAVAMQAYARQAKDSDLIDLATEIRMRAERRAGELLILMGENGERDTRGGDRKSKSLEATLIAQPATLADLGIEKHQSSRWQKIAALPESLFESRVETAKRQAVASVAMTRAERAEDKKERRAEREADLGQRQTAWPTKRFGVILADPEWRFDVWSREGGLDRSADNHYPTSPLEIIRARNVAGIAADDCVLFLWATAPMLPRALEVMAAWGFAYKSNFVWGKDRAGTGYWSRNKHEHLLIGTRGNIPAPAPGTQADSLILAPVGGHSEKPADFHGVIERYFPSLPKIELNARRPRAGWEAWGNEAHFAGGNT